jgi:hypothetical protein
MSGLPIIDVAIGLVFIYLLLALVCTAINELIAGLVSRRAVNLRSGIQRLLDQPDLDDATLKMLSGKLYEHPLIKSLSENDLPSYIPPRTFALALLDLIAPAEPSFRPQAERLREAVSSMPATSNLRRTLLVLIEDSTNNIEKLEHNLESWFDNTMDRVAGLYKRQTQWITLGLAIVIATLVNADTLRLAHALGTNPALREALVAQAQVYAKEASDGAASSATQAKSKPPSSPEARVRESIAELGQLGLPLGWRHYPKDPAELSSAIVGILLTSLAVSLGAPFWFDMLNKVINIRASGKSPRETASSRAAAAPNDTAGAAKR